MMVYVTVAYSCLFFGGHKWVHDRSVPGNLVIARPLPEELRQDLNHLMWLKQS